MADEVVAHSGGMVDRAEQHSELGLAVGAMLVKRKRAGGSQNAVQRSLKKMALAMSPSV